MFRQILLTSVKKCMEIINENMYFYIRALRVNKHISSRKNSGEVSSEDMRCDSK